jgi:ribosome-associated protein
MEVEKLKEVVIQALEDIKARDIVTLHTTKLTALFDYVVIASAESSRQTRALAMNVQEKAKEAGGQVVGMEGEQTGDWVLVDLGSIVVHIMQPAVREYYNLEELWSSDPGSRVAKIRRERRPTPDERTSA